MVKCLYITGPTHICRPLFERQCNLRVAIHQLCYVYLYFEFVVDLSQILLLLCLFPSVKNRSWRRDDPAYTHQQHEELVLLQLHRLVVTHQGKGSHLLKSRQLPWGRRGRSYNVSLQEQLQQNTGNKEGGVVKTGTETLNNVAYMMATSLYQVVRVRQLWPLHLNLYNTTVASTPQPLQHNSGLYTSTLYNTTVASTPQPLQHKLQFHWEKAVGCLHSRSVEDDFTNASSWHF